MSGGHGSRKVGNHWPRVLQQYIHWSSGGQGQEEELFPKVSVRSEACPLCSALIVFGVWTTLWERHENSSNHVILPGSRVSTGVGWVTTELHDPISSQPPDSSQARTVKTKSKSGRVTSSTKIYTLGRNDTGLWWEMAGLPTRWKGQGHGTAQVWVY